MRSSRYYTAPVPKMPAGLIELMDGLARDVLKNNPPDIYEFCADHMKKLLQIRDESNKTCSIKPVLTLEQKIILVKKVVRERAALRREEYDKTIQVYNSEVQGNIKKITEDDVTTEADKYNQGNVIKIHEVDLSGNSEHEIVVKVNVDTTLLQEPDGVTNIHPIAILEKEHVNDIEESYKHDLFIKNNKTDSVCDEGKVTEEIISKTKECESSVDDSVKNIENILSESENIDVPKIILEIEEIKKPIECSNDKTENEDTLDSDIKHHVPPTTSPEDGKDDTIEHNNEKNKINTVDELNITVTYNPDTSGQRIDNVTQNNEIDKSQMDISDIVDKNNSLSNSEPDVQVNNAQNNEMSLAESSNDINNRDLSNGVINLNKLPSSIIDENADEDKINYQELVSEVNNTSMDLETAAITIQKVFRSFLFRNKTLSSDEATNVDINLLIEDKDKSIDDVPSGNANKDRRALGLSRIDTVLQTVNEEKSLSLSTDDSSTLSSAATIIQAHVRGFLVRNKFNLNKANSSTSGFDSDGHSTTSFEADNDIRKNKTVLNIHIVPEGGHFMSRDESLLTSLDLSVDGSPPDSTNLHPLSYDTSERRKQLKREDAIQSISPPSDNSGKQSVEVDSVKEMFGQSTQPQNEIESNNTLHINMQDMLNNATNNTTSANNIVGTVHDSVKLDPSDSSLASLTSDEMDVVTPFAATDSDNDSRIMHSGEFHDVVLPTKVTRTDTSVVRGE